MGTENKVNLVVSIPVNNHVIDFSEKELLALKKMVHGNIALLVAFEDNHAPGNFADLWYLNNQIMNKLNICLGVPTLDLSSAGKN